VTSEKETEKVTSERGRVSDSVLKPKIQEEETTYALSPLESKLEIPKSLFGPRFANCAQLKFKRGLLQDVQFSGPEFNTQPIRPLM
jgi:hypothetical protein